MSWTIFVTYVLTEHDNLLTTNQSLVTSHQSLATKESEVRK